MNEPPEEIQFKVLTLDGGGAKGFYTLGILRELEAVAGKPLAQFFDAIYGTSTGAIIATLLGLGRSVPDTLKLYETRVPKILGGKNAEVKSKQLKATAEELFKDYTWADFKPAMGIVATNWTAERPLIFKNKVVAAHGMKATFIPGFGCTIAEAVRASCSATPFFDPCILDLKNDGKVEARDGGFSANNPSLFALTDVLNGYRVPPVNIRLLSLGVGHYPEPDRGWIKGKINELPPVHLLQKTLDINANTTGILTKYLLPDVPTLRISERFDAPELATDFLETDMNKLNLLVQRGRDSFSQKESELMKFFNNYGKN
jgi:uncharacterized protein